MDEITAISKARRLISDLGIQGHPIDAFGIAESLGFEVQLSNKLDPGEAGKLIPLGNRKIILLNQNDHPYRQRFTVLHEVAHDVLALSSSHGEKLAGSELERFKGRPREEIFCDLFAAECLVPWKRIKPFADSMEYTAATIDELAEQFEASRHCVASRFAQASCEHLAFVPVEDGIVRHAVMSKRLREKQIWIDTGIHVPHNSAAAKALSSGGEHAVAELDGTDWSSSDAAGGFGVREEVLHSARHGQILALLTFEEGVIDVTSDGLADEDGDVLLSELTGYPSWSKK